MVASRSRACAESCTCARHKSLAERAQFRGAAAGQRSRHRRVERRLGKAASHQCVSCPEQARDWAQIHTEDGQDPWADYVPLCRVCHRRYDRIGPRQSARKSLEAMARPRDEMGRFA